MPFIIIEGNRTNKTNNALSLKTSTAANKLTIAATLLVQYYKAFFQLHGERHTNLLEQNVFIEEHSASS